MVVYMDVHDGKCRVNVSRQVLDSVVGVEDDERLFVWLSVMGLCISITVCMSV